jgi:hypothetical protein
MITSLDSDSHIPAQVAALDSLTTVLRHRALDPAHFNLALARRAAGHAAAAAGRPDGGGRWLVQQVLPSPSHPPSLTPSTLSLPRAPPQTPPPPSPVS